jgi:hypothetical protein
MWYGTTLSWDAGNGEMLHVIRQARSPDGQKWLKLPGGVPYAIGTAQAFSRPTVIVNREHYLMWFSYRPGDGTTYRIGRAESPDGENWTFRAGLDLDVSPQGWDSQMVEYPFVFSHSSHLYMLYNGNGFGKSGFGLAVLESSP